MIKSVCVCIYIYIYITVNVVSAIVKFYIVVSTQHDLKFYHCHMAWHGSCCGSLLHVKPASARNLYLIYPIQFYIGAVFHQSVFCPTETAC